MGWGEGEESLSWEERNSSRLFQVLCVISCGCACVLFDIEYRLIVYRKADEFVFAVCCLLSLGIYSAFDLRQGVRCGSAPKSSSAGA